MKSAPRAPVPSALSALLVALLALLAGCAGTPVDRAVLGHVRPLHDFAPPDTLASTLGVSGFVGADGEQAPLQSGDRIRYGLLLQTGERQQRWFVDLEVGALGEHGGPTITRRITINNHPPIVLRSRLVDVTVSVFDGDGALLRRSLAPVGESFLASGLVDAARIVREHGWTMESPAIDLTEAEARRLAQSLLALMALFGTVEENDALSPILWEVVDAPSLWSILLSFGVTVSVEALLDRTDFAAPEILGSGPTAAIPLTIMANGEPALLCTLFATDPTPPFRLCAGVLAVEGVHPTDATRRFSMRLLSAVRGSGR